MFDRIESRHRLANQADGVGIVVGIVVGYAGFTTMYVSTTKSFSTDLLAGGGFHQRRTGQKNGALTSYNNALIGHGRHIGTTGSTRTHYRSNLGNAPGGHISLIKENTAKVLPVWKHLVLPGQIGAAGIHQVDARQVVLFGNGLGAQVFFHRQRKVTAAFDRGVVGDNHAVPARYLANTRDYPGAGYLFMVNVVSGKQPHFQKR